MKRLFVLIFIFFIAAFAQCGFADEIFKVTSANFDTSNSMIVLTSPDFSQKPIMQNVKIYKLDNPSRAYFDIDDAILTIPKQDWTFSTGPLKQIRINQFSTNPNKVRVVMYSDDNFNFDDIKYLRIKNNIIIQLKNNNPGEDYFVNSYRDERVSSSDYYEYLTVSSPIVSSSKSDNVVNQIQQAFNSNAQQIPKQEQTADTVKQNLRLNTGYYLEKLTPKQNYIVINGMGNLTVEKPMILQNPSRIVYDIPNTLVNQNIRNVELKLNDTDTAKLGQFQVNKGRIVITSDNVDKYIPIFSSDNQSLIIGNYEKINPRGLISNISDIAGYHYDKIDNYTGSMILAFNHPIVHGLDRTNNKLTVYLYNVQKYSEDNFRTAFAKSLFYNAQITLMPQIGMKLTIPLENNSIVKTYLGADGRTLKIQVKAPNPISPAPVTAPIKQTYISSGQPKVVIDAGHGGSDCGAIRNNINEKDITLDIAKRVENMLKKQGYHVIMTRDNDTFVSLQDRVAISENSNTDIFVSIHVNSSTKPEITGIETHYYRQESLSLAQTVHAALAGTIKSNNRGLFKSKFYVINHTTAPAILCEIGFISNDNEREQLISDKRKNDTAKAIVEGINNYFKQAK